MTESTETLTQTEEVPASLIGAAAETTAGNETTAGSETTSGSDTSSGQDTVAGESTPGNDSVSGDETTPALTAESYKDLALPEGLVVNDELFGKTKMALAEAGVAPDKAPGLLALYKDALAEQATVLQAANLQAFSDLRAAWQKESLALPELAGAKKEATLASISKVIDAFGTKEVREVLNSTGAGDSPEVVRMMAKIAEALSEGRPVKPGNAPRVGGKLSYAEQVYGDKQT